MQTQIKLRFYDNKRKRLTDVLSVDWEKGIVICLYGGQAWISLIEHGHLLQYSGLKDKHKKKIAEADIVKDEFGLHCEVRFGEFADTKGHVQYGFYIYDVAAKIGRGNMGYDVTEDCPLEVIGNIYENPELLESSD
jgi:uncharacterized phage protein (TIGR01671 family)